MRLDEPIAAIGRLPVAFVHPSDHDQRPRTTQRPVQGQHRDAVSVGLLLEVRFGRDLLVFEFVHQRLESAMAAPALWRSFCQAEDLDDSVQVATCGNSRFAGRQGTASESLRPGVTLAALP